MNETQYRALSKLAGLVKPETREAGRLIMVDKLKGVEAAARAGISQPSISRVKTQLERTLELVQVVAK